MSTIKTRFNVFVDEIRAHTGNADQTQIDKWATDLMDMQHALSEDSTNDLHGLLGVDDHRVFTLLGLGKSNNSAEDYKVVLDIITNHPDQSGGIAVVEFLKSPEGFALMNSPSSKVQKMLTGAKMKHNKDALEAFFGGAFGLELTYTIVKSLRAEEIGTLLTYALSGNYENDRIAFEKNKTEAGDNDARFAFILKKGQRGGCGVRFGHLNQQLVSNC